MKISLDWLGDYVDWTVSDPEEIAKRITAQVAEVDEVEKQGKYLDNCCIGQVKNLRQHPDADKLSLCEVVTDQGDKQIVCGGTNLRDGMKVLFAHVGATVQSPDGEEWTLSKAKIRGETSEGMICAGVEVDMVDRFPETPEQGSRPVIDLGDGNQGIGQDARTYLGLTDTVLHIDNHAITHRADLFSHVGFARECVAIGLGTWKKDPQLSAPAFSKEPVPFTFNNTKPELMPRYCACVLKISDLGDTPDWMKNRLVATGWRSINLPIDITNYVMMEYGVPLHSFDADDISGTITMRPAKDGEKITTLDETERELSEGALILEDDKGIFDLLGIMGGLRASTQDKTRTIYLHSASLDGASVRKAMIAMGHRTDAGTTYEKGVPHITAEQGFYRAVQLFLELAPGAAVASAMEEGGDNGTADPISLSLSRCNQVLGTELSELDVTKILEALGCTVANHGDELVVVPPLWRQGDLSGAHDLIEEVGRIHGYANIPTVMPAASTVPPARDPRLTALRRSLAVSQFYELIPLSLVGPELVKKAGFDPEACPRIENPLGEELSLAQPSVLPRLLEQAGTAQRQIETLKTFTISHVFTGNTEHNELGLLVTSSVASLNDEPLLLAKEALLTALRAAGYEAAVKPTATSALSAAHPGRCAEVLVGKTVVGSLFEVHPSTAAAFDLEKRVAVAVINADALLALSAEHAIYQTMPQFPAITYDETITATHSKKVSGLLQKAQEQSKLLESVSVADLYADKKATDGTYKLTLRFVYRAADRTLTEDEVKADHQKVMAVLA